MRQSEITLRRATPADARASFDVSMAAMKDLFVRQGQEWKLDPESFWTALKPFLTHLATHAAEWWLAEDEAGSIVGYARSIERGGLFELSEFFVHPDRQSAGVGRRLLEHAFPLGRGDVRAIIATTDVRGLHRYYAAGTLVRFAMANLTGAPSATRDDVRPIEVESATVKDAGEVAAIEEEVFGYPRHADYPWLFAHREAYLFRRAGRAVGFAFSSATGQGPIAALDPADLRPILIHLEARARASGLASLSFEVPTINDVAMNHLLGRGFKLEGPLNLMMSNVPFGKFDRLIAFSPSIVL